MSPLRVDICFNASIFAFFSLPSSMCLFSHSLSLFSHSLSWLSFNPSPSKIEGIRLRPGRNSLRPNRPIPQQRRTAAREEQGDLFKFCRAAAGNRSHRCIGKVFCLLLVRADYIRPHPRARARGHEELLKLLHGPITRRFCHAEYKIVRFQTVELSG